MRIRHGAGRSLFDSGHAPSDDRRGDRARQARGPERTDSRTEIPFGTLTVTARVDDQVPERRKIIFDPLPRVDGIDSSGDPITEVRADVYLLSGRRRRAVFGDGGR